MRREKVDAKYWTDRFDEAFHRFDWEKVGRHLHSQRARKLLEDAKRQVYNFGRIRIEASARQAEKPDLSDYIKHVSASCKNSTSDNLRTQKLQWIQGQGGMFGKGKVLLCTFWAGIVLGVGLTRAVDKNVMGSRDG